MLKKFSLLVFLLPLFFISRAFTENTLKVGTKTQPIIINGDNVEYSTDAQEVTASGNVEIISGETKLTCQKLTVNTQTKLGKASGHARLDDQKGIIESEEIIYNFQTKEGLMNDAKFRASPYFGKARKVEKDSGAEFIARYGYMTTCSFNRPHYHIGSKQMNIIPKEKIQTKDDCFYLGGFPLFYASRFNHTFEKPIMHVSAMPGKKKEWGPFLLSIWRFSLSPNVEARGYLDYRNKLGWAEGVGANYQIPSMGKGDIKFYHSDEQVTRNMLLNEPTDEYQRYLIRLRHKWDIDKQTNFIAEFYKIRDEKRKFDLQSDMLKDYFFREYEKDVKPLSYVLFHHSFSYSSFDLLLEKRTNHWYNQLDKKPEIRYVLPSLQLGESPFYFENSSALVNFNKMAVTSPQTVDDLTVTRLDTINRVSLPMRVFFLQVAPFLQDRQTIYDKSATDSSLPVRTIFTSGVDVSTKFYRFFDIKSNVFGLDLEGLRHVITPTIAYAYSHKPTIPFYNLKRIDGVDLLTSSNAATLELSNKLQTKRKDKDGKVVKIDLVDFNVSTTYAFAPNIVYGSKIDYVNNLAVNEVDTGRIKKGGDSFSDFLFRLKLLPYAWMRIEADTTYKHSGVPGDADDVNNNHFSNVNYDIYFDFAPERSFGLGQRYQRKGQNQVTASFEWRLNPKWKFSIYERFNLKSYVDTSIFPNANVGKTAIEQQYTLSRNLHCWDIDLTIGRSRNSGSSIYIVFRLKAFPENEFSINQVYDRPKSGAQ